MAQNQYMIISGLFAFKINDYSNILIVQIQQHLSLWGFWYSISDIGLFPLLIFDINLFHFLKFNIARPACVDIW